MRVPEGPPIVHVDVDAFFVSVSVRDDPTLRGLPVAVAVPDGIVACAGYPARALGVHAGMPTRDALRLCPQLVTVGLASAAYERASTDLFDVLAEVGRTVEPGSMEEAFVDVPDLSWDDVATHAAALRRRLCEATRLPVSMGVGRTKMMAKLASRAAKPDGLQVITPTQEAEQRPGLRLADLWGVGGRTLARLDGAGLVTVADLSRLSLDDLCTLAGTGMGRRLHAIARGTDDAVVRERGPRTSLGAETSLRSPTPAQLDDALTRLAHRVADRLRVAGLRCGRVTVADRRASVGASATLDVPTDDAAVLVATARGLLAARPRGHEPDGVRVVAGRLTAATGVDQPTLPGF